MNPIYPAELRRRAREAIWGRLPNVLLVALFAAVPSLVFQMALMLSSNSLIRAFQMYQQAEMSPQVLRRIMQAAAHDMGSFALLLWQLLPVLFLMLPFLSIGQNYAYLRLLRQEEMEVRDVFARVSCFFKAIFLEILVLIRMILWGIPGFLVMVLGGVFFIRSRDLNMFSMVYTFGTALMFFLAYRANLRYSLASIVMADKPENSALTCLRESIRLMNGRLMQLFSVVITFVLYLLLEELAVNMVASLSYVLGLTVNVVLGLFIQAWRQTSVCAYYLERMREENRSELEDKVPFSDDVTELN